MMTPIQDLLHRIRWDAAYGAAQFEIGYWDRVADRLVVVPLSRIAFPTGDHFAFETWDDRGEAHTVPLHRVRKVWRDGELVWHRPYPGERG